MGVEQRHLCFAVNTDTQTHMLLPGETNWLALDWRRVEGKWKGFQIPTRKPNLLVPSGKSRQLASSCAAVAQP